MNINQTFRYAFLLVLLNVLQFNLEAQNKTSYIPSDVAQNIPKAYVSADSGKYKGLDFSTYYITMRDSIRIAIDVYLPKHLEENAKIPTLIHQTRYWRSPDLRWPFSMFTNGLLGPMGKAIQEVVSNGYAIVNMDSRGSGASFGSRAYPWSEDEYKDLAEIIDWIIAQPWSNQNVGTIGVSYSGTTAEFALVNQHPNLKAAIVMYSLFDVYEDIAFPGGIYHEFFVENWGNFNEKLDNNNYPRKSFLARLLLKGVRRVKGERKVRTFKDAIKDHQGNLQVSATSEGIVYKNDVPKFEGVVSSAAFSPYSFQEEINASQTPMYFYSGWLDGNYQRAAIRKFLTYTNPQNKLMIGPWEHGGQYNCSAANPGKAGFNHVSEYLKFFDYHLKGIENGLYDEPKVNYFTMGEEQWKQAESWPIESKTKTLYCSFNNQINIYPPTELNVFDSYKVDTTAQTGDYSRWKSLIGMLKTGEVYPDRIEADKKLMIYETLPLTDDLEVTGHPLFYLYVQSTASDGNFHVYLEDVAPNGNVSLITEGLLRGIHRKVSDAHPPYKMVAPYHSYLKEDAELLNTNEIEELVIDLIPTSYQFKKGHKIRIALAGADRTHFQHMVEEVPEWKIYRSKIYPTRLELPVVE